MQHYFEVKQEGERLILRRSNRPLIHDTLTFGGISTALGVGAWQSWAQGASSLTIVLAVLATATGASAAKMWQQLQLALTIESRWIFDRAQDAIEHDSERQCALSDVAQIHLVLDWRHEHSSLQLRMRHGQAIGIEEDSLAHDQAEVIARQIAQFARVELIVERHD